MSQVVLAWLEAAIREGILANWITTQEVLVSCCYYTVAVAGEFLGSCSCWREIELRESCREVADVTDRESCCGSVAGKLHGRAKIHGVELHQTSLLRSVTVMLLLRERCREAAYTLQWIRVHANRRLLG